MPKPPLLRENDEEYNPTVAIRFKISKKDHDFLELLRHFRKKSFVQLFSEWIQDELSKQLWELADLTAGDRFGERLNPELKSIVEKGGKTAWDQRKEDWLRKTQRAERIKKRRERYPVLTIQQKKERKLKRIQAARQRKLEEIKSEGELEEPDECHPSFGRWQVDTTGPASNIKQYKGEK